MEDAFSNPLSAVWDVFQNKTEQTNRTLTQCMLLGILRSTFMHLMALSCFMQCLISTRWNWSCVEAAGPPWGSGGGVHPSTCAALLCKQNWPKQLLLLCTGIKQSLFVAVDPPTHLLCWHNWSVWLHGRVILGLTLKLRQKALFFMHWSPKILPGLPEPLYLWIWDYSI